MLEARRAAEKPKRSRGGRIMWKRSVPLAGFALTDEIEAAAATARAAFAYPAPSTATLIFPARSVTSTDSAGSKGW